MNYLRLYGIPNKVQTGDGNPITLAFDMIDEENAVTEGAWINRLFHAMQSPDTFCAFYDAKMFKAFRPCDYAALWVATS